MYGEQRRSAAVGFVCALLAAVLAPASAMAFEAKHTASGMPVKWTSTNVSYVVDPTVAANVPGGADAVAAAAEAWSGMEGAPKLSTTAGPGGGVVAADGQNTILLVPEGFAPADGALAITVLTYEESTGAIVDADIVVNGEHAFAVLASGARAADGVAPVSNEGSPDGEGEGGPRFDLGHVAAHELGHSLGLGDVRDQAGEVMYAFSRPGDASYRAPAPDDVDGLAEIYGGSPPAHAGCGASVAGGPSRPEDTWAALALALAGAWAVSRRRARALVPVWPVCAMIAVLAGGADAARSAPGVVSAAAEAVGTVAAASTCNVGGVFQTTLDVVPTSCRSGSCPATARVLAWGGTLAGITQQVGEYPVPQVGDRVALAFVGASRGRANAGAVRETDSRCEAVLVR
jgi:MYXO-CTERM domain-containing protein